MCNFFSISVLLVPIAASVIERHSHYECTCKGRHVVLAAHCYEVEGERESGWSVRSGSSMSDRLYPVINY